jgi:hypothetical protein
MADTDEIQKVDPRKASLAKARAARAAKRLAQAAAPQPVDDGLGAMQEAQAAAAADAVRQARGPTPSPEQTSAAARTPIRSGRTEAIGRGGEVLSRKRTSSGDIFDVPAELIPKGWKYQWCAVSVTGNTEILMDQNLMFAENGWRPVPASRYPGRYMPAGHTGAIVRGSQMLMERPKILSDEAEAEDVRLAKQLISDRNDSLKLSGVRKSLGDGFEMNEKYRGTGGDIRMSIDRALDAPAPSHKLADPGE